MNEHNDTPSLLPCPFCGESEFVGLGYKPHPTRPDRYHTVSCEPCGANSGFWPSEERAIESWNTRQSTDEIAEKAIREFVRDVLANPPKHVYWGAGEADCPKDIKAPNGELHTLRCKLCEQPKSVFCAGRLAKERGIDLDAEKL